MAKQSVGPPERGVSESAHPSGRTHHAGDRTAVRRPGGLKARLGTVGPKSGQGDVEGRRGQAVAGPSPRPGARITAHPEAQGQVRAVSGAPVERLARTGR